METKYSIKEEVKLISRYYDFLSKDKIKQKAIESLYNKQIELIRDTLMKDVTKPLNITLKLDSEFVISIIS